MHAINGYAANGLNGERGGNSGSSASHLSLIFFFGWAHETVMVFFLLDTKPFHHTMTHMSNSSKGGHHLASWT
jgi:hypothetical protein